MRLESGDKAQENKILLQPPCPNLPVTSSASCFPLSYQEENAALAEAEDTSLAGTASSFLLKEPQTINLLVLSQHLLSTCHQTSNPVLLGSLGRCLVLHPGHFQNHLCALGAVTAAVQGQLKGRGLAFSESPRGHLLPLFPVGPLGTRVALSYICTAVCFSCSQKHEAVSLPM